jgi:hypothetical protein
MIISPQIIIPKISIPKKSSCKASAPSSCKISIGLPELRNKIIERKHAKDYFFWLMVQAPS